jgi:hypothetical protein
MLRDTHADDFEHPADRKGKGKKKEKNAVSEDDLHEPGPRTAWISEQLRGSGAAFFASACPRHDLNRTVVSKGDHTVALFVPSSAGVESIFISLEKLSYSAEQREKIQKSGNLIFSLQ